MGLAQAWNSRCQGCGGSSALRAGTDPADEFKRMARLHVLAGAQRRAGGGTPGRSLAPCPNLNWEPSPTTLCLKVVGGSLLTHLPQNTCKRRLWASCGRKAGLEPCHLPEGAVPIRCSRNCCACPHPVLSQGSHVPWLS